MINGMRQRATKKLCKINKEKLIKKLIIIGIRYKRQLFSKSLPN
ncbi:hypothetical protein DOY81_011056 [Sarcophaga bullata]|nr:hypothetical protein DOY81_011056 [Sarcophaga bullata]